MYAASPAMRYVRNRQQLICNMTLVIHQMFGTHMRASAAVRHAKQQQNNILYYTHYSPHSGTELTRCTIMSAAFACRRHCQRSNSQAADNCRCNRCTCTKQKEIPVWIIEHFVSAERQCAYRTSETDSASPTDNLTTEYILLYTLHCIHGNSRAPRMMIDSESYHRNFTSYHLWTFHFGYFHNLAYIYLWDKEAQFHV